MADLSIRELAVKLGVSHTAIRNAIADIELETGEKLGKSQGQGKATLLDSYAQELIASKFFKPAAEKTSQEATIHQGQMTYGVPGLVPQKGNRIRGTLADIQQAKAEYQATGQQAVAEAAEVLRQFATFKAVQTMSEIDAIYEGLKASAMNQSVNSLGKQDEVEAG